ncbi:MAG TPA: MMPL family transporter [Chloroflexota bacterium]
MDGVGLETQPDPVPLCNPGGREPVLPQPLCYTQRMLYSLGRFVYRRRWAVIAAWVTFIVAALPLVPAATSRLQFGGLTSDRMESVRARQLLQRSIGVPPSTLVVLFNSPTLSVDDPEFNRLVSASTAGLAGAPEVAQVVDYLTNPRQISPDRHSAFDLVVLKAGEEQSARQISSVLSRLRQPGTEAIGPQPSAISPPGSGSPFTLHSSPFTPPLASASPVTMYVTGGPIFFSEVERLSHEDLQRAEIFAFPIAAVALLVVFGSLVAAGLPVALGGVTVVGILATITLLSRATDLSIFVMNVATMLGLGLGVDYSLFMTSRFREELRGTAESPESRVLSAERWEEDSGLRTQHSSQPVVEAAVASTVATAGKAVLFSGLSVFIGLAGLASFEFMLLRSLGLVGMAGILICVAAAMTLLPAILGVLGERVNRFPVLGDRLSAGDFWERSAAWVMRHPVRVFVPTLALLIALGVPFLHVRFSAPDAYILPPDLPSRQALDLLRREFGESATAPVEVVISFESGSALDPGNLSTLYDFTRSVASDPRVTGVRSVVNIDPRITKAQYLLLYSNPGHIADAYAAQVAKVTSGGRVALVELQTRDAPVSEDSKSLVRDVRSMRLPPGMSVLVTGTSAEVIDVVDTIYADAPLALGFVVVAIYIVLFVMFRSVLLPAKAVIMNSLSIIASYGALVFIFQDGHLQNLLHFESTGTVEASMPVIMFCILFGLSMDYEVFLLSRIREEYDRTGNNTASVAKGLEKSGKIITSAAVIVVAVGIAFSAADIVIIKALGLGIAIAVFLDATVVRTLLVPATMRLLGDWNWWMPWKGEG